MTPNLYKNTLQSRLVQRRYNNNHSNENNRSLKIKIGSGSIVGTNGASDCCSATILASGVTCDLGVEAPCVMLNGTYTDAPAATPTVPSNVTAGATPAPSAGSRDLFTEAPTMMGDVNGEDGVAGIVLEF